MKQFRSAPACLPQVNAEHNRQINLRKNGRFVRADVTRHALGASDIALINGDHSAVNGGATSGINGLTAWEQGMSPCGAAIICQREQQGINADKVAGRIANNRAIAAALDQVKTRRCQHAVAIGTGLN